MASVINPLLSGQAVGKVGGTVYQRSRVGTIARAWAKPVKNRREAATVHTVTTFTKALQEWQNISSTLRERWEDFSRKYPRSDTFGQSRHIPAFMWFMKHNLISFGYFDTVTYSPPVTPCIDYLPTLAMEWTASGAQLSWGTAIPSERGIVVFQRRTLSTGKKARGAMVHSHTFDSSDSSPQLVTPDCGNGGGPGTLPPFGCNTGLQFEVATVSIDGRKSVSQYFEIFAT